MWHIPTVEDRKISLLIRDDGSPNALSQYYGTKRFHDDFVKKGVVKAWLVDDRNKFNPILVMPATGRSFAAVSTEFEQIYCVIAGSRTGDVSPVVVKSGEVVGHMGWFRGDSIYSTDGNSSMYGLAQTVAKGAVTYIATKKMPDRNPWGTSEDRHQCLVAPDGKLIEVFKSEATGQLEASSVTPLDLWMVGKLIITLGKAGVSLAVRALVRKETQQVFARGALIESVTAVKGLGAAPVEATEVLLTEAEYQLALTRVFPQVSKPLASVLDDIGQKAAVRAMNNPAFVSALQAENWSLAGTLFHTAARDEARLLSAGALPTGWSISAEEAIVKGKGGSTIDVLLRGPAGEIAEVDWKTTGASALTKKSQMAKHAGHIWGTLNGVTKLTQESASWYDYVRPLARGSQGP